MGFNSGFKGLKPLSKGDKHCRSPGDQIFELVSFAQSDNNDAHCDVVIFSYILIVHSATVDRTNAAKFMGIYSNTHIARHILNCLHEITHRMFTHEHPTI